MTGKSKISRSQRLIATAVLVVLSSVLAGCGGGLNNFDPTDMLDWLDTKKKLPGERKPVFPEGVPGLAQGVPKELYKGAQQQPDEQVTPAAAAPPPEEPKTKRSSRSKAKSEPAPAASPAQPAETEAAPEEDGSTAAAPPAPKPKKVARKRANSLSSDNKSAAPAPATGQAQPVQQTQAPPAFPAPLPSGSFSR